MCLEENQSFSQAKRKVAEVFEKVAQVYPIFSEANPTFSDAKEKVHLANPSFLSDYASFGYANASIAVAIDTVQ